MRVLNRIELLSFSQKEVFITALDLHFNKEMGRQFCDPSRSSLDLSCTDELSKSETAAVYRLIVYYAP